MKELGFPEPGPVPCMRLEHQIAQKLHAASSPGSNRAHDLIDLQIAVSNGKNRLPEDTGSLHPPLCIPRGAKVAANDFEGKGLGFAVHPSGGRTRCSTDRR